MVSSSPIQILETDIWVKVSWEEFLELADDPKYEEGKFYYQGIYEYKN